MSRSLNFLAVDLGAESGRAVLGTLQDERLRLTEVHRFPNGPIRVAAETRSGGLSSLGAGDGLHWDVLRIWAEIKTGICKTIREYDAGLASIGVDTWGVDFALLDRQGALIGNPYHYRDSRTEGMVEEVFRRVPRAEVFRQTGIQFLAINGLYQLYSMVANGSPALEIADTFLTIPDLLNYWLSGRQVSEFTIATTTQCYDPCAGTWAWPLLEALGIRTGMFREIVSPGTILGPMLPAVAQEVGSGPIPIIVPACHDTGSAVAAVPAASKEFVWISSGTWSILGTELRQPMIDAKSLAFNFTNEGGVDGTFRFCKNITALWLVQECRRTWAAQGQPLSYGELTRLAAEAAPFQAVLDPDAADFARPGDMPARVRAYCQATGQPVPESQGALVRCVLESIALKYRYTLAQLEEVVGHSLGNIYIVGGGTQNQLLSQFTADATGRVVVTGPVEATAAGNVLAQAIALGHVGSLAAARTIVRNSFDPLTFEPKDRSGWDDAYARLLPLIH